MKDGQPIDRPDIVNNIRDIGRKEDFENRGSTSLLRMKEMGSKIDTAKSELSTGH
jgi:hypothetical protein